MLHQVVLRLIGCCNSAHGCCVSKWSLPFMLHVAVCPLILQVCLAGSMQTDDCAAETHGCWTHSEGLQQFSACKDTFRGYVCKCPEGGVCLPAPLPSLCLLTHVTGVPWS